jgi:hypothetical protein
VLPKLSKSAKSKSTKTQTAPLLDTQAKPQAKEKDWDAAYGALATQYGFGGAPIAPGSASWMSKK